MKRSLLLATPLVISTLALSTVARGQHTSAVRGFQDKAQASEQEASEWCWAASIQAVLAYYGIQRGQSDIVLATFGRVDNVPARSPEVLYRTLNNFQIAGDSVEIVRSQWATGNYLTATMLDNELRANHPIITWFMNGPSSGHSVVIYSADFAADGEPYRVKYFDPWPGKGFQTTTAQPFGSQIVAFFVVRAARLGSASSTEHITTRSNSQNEAQAMQECLNRKVRSCIEDCMDKYGYTREQCVNALCTLNEFNLSKWRPACTREIRRREEAESESDD